jgi:hypothetical protein
VKMMGRESGFLAAYATLANSQVNFWLVPEVPFKLESLFKALEERLARQGYAVMVAAEAAGADLLAQTGKLGSSGNVLYADIGIFLRDRMRGHFSQIGRKVELKYNDPSSTIRSLPANARDSVSCLLLGQNALHAGCPGRLRWWAIGTIKVPTCPSPWRCRNGRNWTPRAGFGTASWPSPDSLGIYSEKSRRKFIRERNHGTDR